MTSPSIRRSPTQAPSRSEFSHPGAELSLDVLRDEHYHRLAQEIESKVGIKLPPSKKTMVEGRLRRRTRALGLPSLEAYGRLLFEGGSWHKEFDLIVDCVTTNKTDFFREPEHFHILRDLVMPMLCGPRAAKPPSTIKVWSAACSTGAEAYTLAMVLSELQARSDFAFSLFGTDINTHVLETARRAIYAHDLAAPIPTHLRRAYTMDAIEAQRREFRIVPELRKLARFSQLNLMDGSFEVERDFHVIFCRNVLIYFEKDIQKAVVARLALHLAPKGFLFLGHSEATAGGDHRTLRQVAPTVFQREA